jgi:hypothetical protein
MKNLENSIINLNEKYLYIKKLNLKFFFQTLINFLKLKH